MRISVSAHWRCAARIRRPAGLQRVGGRGVDDAVERRVRLRGNRGHPRKTARRRATHRSARNRRPSATSRAVEHAVLEVPVAGGCRFGRAAAVRRTPASHGKAAVLPYATERREPVVHTTCRVRRQLRGRRLRLRPWRSIGSRCGAAHTTVRNLTHPFEDQTPRRSFGSLSTMASSMHVPESSSVTPVGWCARSSISTPMAL